MHYLVWKHTRIHFSQNSNSKLRIIKRVTTDLCGLALSFWNLSLAEQLTVKSFLITYIHPYIIGHYNTSVKITA